MLSRRENRFNVAFIRVYAFFKLLPIKVEPRTGRISCEISHFGRLIWKFILEIEILRSFHLNLLVVSTLLNFNAQFHLLRFTIICLSASGSLLMTFWSLYIFRVHKHAIVLLYNEVFSSAPDRILRPGFAKYSRQELLALVLPFGLFFATMAMFVMLTAGTNGDLLICNWLPSDWRSPSMFALSIFLDLVFYLLWAASANFTLNLQLAFFDLQIRELDDLSSRIKKRLAFTNTPISDLWLCSSSCRKHQLLTQLFNLVKSKVIFSFKIMCTSFAVIPAVLAIRVMKTDVLVGILYLYFALVAVCCYAFIYERAFAIPEKMNVYKCQLLMLGSERLRDKDSWEKFKRTISSVRSCGISVGGFRDFRRNSTLGFLDMVAVMIANLLISTA